MKKFLKVLLIIAAIGGFIWFIVNSRLQQVKAADDMENVVVSLENYLVANKDRIPKDAIMGTFGALEWYDFYHDIDEEDLRPSPTQVPKVMQGMLRCDEDGYVVDYYKMYQYTAARTDQWGTPYLITIVDCNGFEPCAYALAVMSAGANKTFFAPGRDENPDWAIEHLDSDDVCFISYIYEDFTIRHEAVAKMRSGYELLPDLISGRKQTQPLN